MDYSKIAADKARLSNDLLSILKQLQEEHRRLHEHDKARHFVAKDGTHYVDYGIRSMRVDRPCICSIQILFRTGCVCNSSECYICEEN